MGKSQSGALALSTKLCRAGSWVSLRGDAICESALCRRAVCEGWLGSAMKPHGYTIRAALGIRTVSVIGELAGFVAGAKISTLPAAEQERLRLHFTDTAVAALAGAHIPEGRAL